MRAVGLARLVPQLGHKGRHFRTAMGNHVARLRLYGPRVNNGRSRYPQPASMAQSWIGNGFPGNRQGFALSLDEGRPIRLKGDRRQVRWIRVQDQLRVDPQLGYVNDTYPEMLMPAAIGRRSGVEDDGSVYCIDEGNVTVPEKRKIDLPRIFLFYLVFRGPPSIAMERAKSMTSDREQKPPGQHLLKVIVVVVAGDGQQRSEFSQLHEHPAGVHIPEVDDKPNARPVKKVEHRNRQFPRAMRINVGVRDHADRERHGESAP